METVLESLRSLQEELREKNQKYNEMKQRFETSNEVGTVLCCCISVGLS